MQCACATLSSVASTALLYFSTLSHKRHDVREKKKYFDTKCLFWFYLQILSATFLIIRRSERHMTKIYIDLDVKYLLFWPDFNAPWIFSKNCKKYSNIKYHENPCSGTRVVPSGRTDRQKEMTKLIVAFHNFANDLKGVSGRIHINLEILNRLK